MSSKQISDKIICIFLGAPGSGKGTASVHLCENYKLVHIATGDILRNKIKSNSSEGKILKNMVDSGILVSDEIVINLVKESIDSNPNCKGYLLDGFPRTIEQARSLELLLKEKGLRVTFVLLLKATSETLVRRVAGRLIHIPSSRIYHLVYSPPKVPMIDDVSGEPLTCRDDDKEEVIKHRIEVYKEMIDPLIQFYQEKSVLVEINAEQSMDLVFKDISTVFQKYTRP